MPKDKELNQRDTKLVTWLSEAHAKEAELEADLTAHIALTEKASYKKRLQQHLKQTREHKRATAKRIRELGGNPPQGGAAMPGVPGAIGELAGKTVAAVKGQVGTARAAGYLPARDPPAQRAGGASRGACGDRHLHADRDAGHRGRRP